MKRRRTVYHLHRFLRAGALAGYIVAGEPSNGQATVFEHPAASVEDALAFLGRFADQYSLKKLLFALPHPHEPALNRLKNLSPPATYSMEAAWPGESIVGRILTEDPVVASRFPQLSTKTGQEPGPNVRGSPICVPDLNWI